MDELDNLTSEQIKDMTDEELEKKFAFKRNWTEDIIPYGIRMRYYDVRYWFREIFLYKPHRAMHGWASNDTWNLNNYLTRITIETLTHLKDNTHGYPADYKHFDEWKKELDTVIQAFKDYDTYDDDSHKRLEALESSYGIKSFREIIKESGNNWQEIFNNKRERLPNEVYKKHYDEEAIIHEEIKVRMKKLIDVYDGLWD